MNKTGVFGCGIGSSAAVQSSQTDAEAFRGACSHYKSGLTFAQIWNTAEQAASVAVSGGVTYCRIHDGNHAAAADFKAYLAAQYAAGTPVQIAYPLAAETKIDLPPQMVLALAGENSLWSDCGETEVQGALSPAWRDQQQDRRIAALEAALLNECVGDGEGRLING